MKQENEEVVTTTTKEGDTSFMICKANEENKDQKVCMDIENRPETAANQSEGKGQKRMLNNGIYDLMEQLLVENKSLWRIKNNYKNDSSMDIEVKQLWDVIEKDKEELVSMLTEKLKERL